MATVARRPVRVVSGRGFSELVRDCRTLLFLSTNRYRASLRANSISLYFRPLPIKLSELRDCAFRGLFRRAKYGKRQVGTSEGFKDGALLYGDSFFYFRAIFRIFRDGASTILVHFSIYYRQGRRGTCGCFRMFRDLLR